MALPANNECIILFCRPHTLQTSSRSSGVLPNMMVAVPGSGDSPYLKQFVHSKSQQYRKLKNEWKNYVFLGRSRIQVTPKADIFIYFAAMQMLISIAICIFSSCLLTV